MPLREEEHDWVGFSHCMLCARKTKLQLEKDITTLERELAEAKERLTAANATIAACKTANTLVWKDDAELGCFAARWSGWRFAIYDSPNGWRWNQTAPGLGMDGGHEATAEQAMAAAQACVDRMVKANIAAAKEAQ